jgi:hypothetical protein
VPAVVQSRFSEDVAGELPGYVAAATPDTIVLGAGVPGSGMPGSGMPGSGAPDAGGSFRAVLGADGTTQLVTVLRPPPAAPGSVAVRWARGANGEAAVQVATQLAVANRLNLVIVPGGGRRAAVAAGLTRRGVTASDGPLLPGALLVAASDDGCEDAHLAVLAGSKEGSDDLDQWVQALDERRIL